MHMLRIKRENAQKVCTPRKTNTLKTSGIIVLCDWLVELRAEFSPGGRSLTLSLSWLLLAEQSGSRKVFSVAPAITLVCPLSQPQEPLCFFPLHLASQQPLIYSTKWMQVQTPKKPQMRGFQQCSLACLASWGFCGLSGS